MYATGAPVIKMKAKAKRPSMKAPAPAMKMKAISPAVEKRLQAHKVKGKHTAKHITKMRKMLREGKTFTQAHSMASSS